MEVNGFSLDGSADLVLTDPALNVRRELSRPVAYYVPSTGSDVRHIHGQPIR